jgi:hypothetical protein
MILSLFQLSVSWHSTGLSPRPEQEMWWIGDYFPDADLVNKTINDFSKWNTGVKSGIDVKIINNSQPSLEWLLRDQNVTREEVLSPLEKTSIIISKEEGNPILENNYRGQRFVLSSVPFWKFDIKQAFQSNDFARWFFLRDGSLVNENLILWSRKDLFIDSGSRFERKD